MPTRKKIFDYWKDNNYAVDDNTCFKCGFTTHGTAVERAHISSFYATKDNSVDNLHLLCKNCHLESEVYEGDSYWVWFNLESTGNSKNDRDRFYTANTLAYYKGEITLPSELAEQLNSLMDYCVNTLGGVREELIKQMEVELNKDYELLN